MRQALQQGECRCYGRGLLKTYLHTKFSHNARDDDVRDALSHLNKISTNFHRPGLKKTINEANISHLDQTSFGVVIAMINFVIMALKSMLVLTLTLDKFNGAM